MCALITPAAVHGFQLCWEESNKEYREESTSNKEVGLCFLGEENDLTDTVKNPQKVICCRRSESIASKVHNDLRLISWSSNLLLCTQPEILQTLIVFVSSKQFQERKECQKEGRKCFS